MQVEVDALQEFDLPDGLLELSLRVGSVLADGVSDANGQATDLLGSLLDTPDTQAGDAFALDRDVKLDEGAGVLAAVVAAGHGCVRGKAGN